MYRRSEGRGVTHHGSGRQYDLREPGPGRSRLSRSCRAKCDQTAWGQQADNLVIMSFQGSGLRKAVEMLVRLSPQFPIDLIARRPEDVRRQYAEGDPLIGEALDEGIVPYERDNQGVAA